MKDFSICIPAYNYADYLEKAIDSCLACDYDFELVVLDNFSSDHTPILKEKYLNNQRVKWFRNDSLLPIQKNWNKAVSLTNGKYVKLLQADDMLLPEFFEIFKDVINNKIETSIVGHLAIMIDENGKEIRKQVSYGKESEYFVRGNEALKLKLRNVSRFKEPSCNFYKREAWEKVGGYRDDIRFVFDIAFNSLIAYHLGGKLINRYGAAVRRHSASDGSKLPSQLALNELDGLIKDFYELLGNDLKSDDRKNGISMVQYRIIELFLQKVRKTPLESCKFLFSNINYFKNLSSIPYTLATLRRKIDTNDIQKSFE